MMYTIGRCPHCDEVIKTNNINIYVHQCVLDGRSNLYIGNQTETNFLVAPLTINSDGTATRGIPPKPPQFIDDNIF